jgi:hypothetical protein
MKIVEMKPSELKPYARNNRKHPQAQIDKLAKQIAAHGWDVPIVVDKDFVIIKGHCRWKCAKQLKLKTVPVVVRDDLTPEQCNAARLADNKLSESIWKPYRQSLTRSMLSTLTLTSQRSTLGMLFHKLSSCPGQKRTKAN